MGIADWKAVFFVDVVLAPMAVASLCSQGKADTRGGVRFRGAETCELHHIVGWRLGTSCYAFNAGSTSTCLFYMNVVALSPTECLAL